MKRKEDIRCLLSAVYWWWWCFCTHSTLKQRLLAWAKRSGTREPAFGCGLLAWKSLSANRIDWVYYFTLNSNRDWLFPRTNQLFNPGCVRKSLRNSWWVRHVIIGDVCSWNRNIIEWTETSCEHQTSRTYSCLKEIFITTILKCLYILTIVFWLISVFLWLTCLSKAVFVFFFS